VSDRPVRAPEALDADIQRWAPDPATLRIARAMIDAACPDPAQDHVVVYVGIALPGKARSVWTLGQPVEVAPGFWLARTDAEVSHARDHADRAAKTQLAGRAGQTSYAAVRRSGCAVFDGVYGAR
jgi:hypothetical protein